MSKVQAEDTLSPYAVSKLITCSLTDVTDHTKEVNEYLSGNALILLGSCCSCDIREIAKILTSLTMVHDWKTKEYEFIFDKYDLFTNVNYPSNDISKLKMSLSKDSNEIIVHVRGRQGYRKNTYTIE